MNLTVKKSSVLTAFLLAIAWLTSVLLDWYAADVVMATCILAMLSRKVNAKSSIELMFMVGFSVFIYFPALVNGFLFETSFALFYATAVISFFFLHSVSGLEYRPPVRWSIKNFYFFLLSCVAVVGVSFFGDYAHYVLSPFVMFYALSLRPGRQLRNLLIFAIFFCTFLVYYFIGWGGFGRTVTFGILLVGVLYFMYASNIKVSKIAFTVLPIVGSLFLVGRKTAAISFDIEAAANDSAIGPYRLASTFVNASAERGIDISGFFDQVIFTLFIWVPRQIWPSKPFGFGYQWVVDNMADSFVDAGHSIASTFIGDHLYFFGWWGMLTAAAMAYGIARFCRFLYSMKLFSGFGVVIISCQMMVLVWGGMTSLSARVASPLVALAPFLLLYAFRRLSHHRPSSHGASGN